MANFIVKIVNGKPVVFGSSGKDTGIPCYVFEEKEAYDAAIAEGLVPVGSLIFKTYDAAEMAGGPFDDEFSDSSDNAPQNKIVKAAIDRLDQSIADALALRASLTGFGLGKVCPADLVDATEANGLVLGAFEKNAAVSGSLAREISKAKILKYYYSTEMIIPEDVPYTDKTIELPENVSDTYICAVLREVWPMDSWNLAYARANLIGEPPELLLNVTGPRSGRFRVSYDFLYYESG